MRRWTPEELDTLDEAVLQWKEGPYAALPSGWSVVAHRVNSRHSTSRSARSCEARWDRAVKDSAELDDLCATERYLNEEVE